MDLGRFNATLAQVERDALAGFAAPPAPRPSPADRAAAAALRRSLAAALGRFARALEFTVTVPGTHHSGLSNDELFEVLAAQGRDFAADTRRLRDHVRIGLLQAFGDAEAVPLLLDVEQEAKALVLAWVAARMDGRIRDERLTPLTPRYAARKRRLHPDRPIGIATGALYDALIDRGRVDLA